MSASDQDWPASPLDAVDAAFAKLTCHPQPLTLDLDSVGAATGLPAGVMDLPALREWLLAHPHAYPARDAVWRELIRRARLDGPGWVIAAVGMAMPALRRLAGRLVAGWDGDPHDVDGELLTGFLTALRDRVDASRPAPYAGLCMAAWRAGLRLRQQDAEAIPVEDMEHVIGPRTPRLPYGHPDVLVRRAVALGILDPVDEQPYIDVRLGHRAIEPIAARLGLSVDTLRRRMHRIDLRLANAVENGLLTDIVSGQTEQHLRRRAAHRTATRAAVTTRPVPTAA